MRVRGLALDAYLVVLRCTLPTILGRTPVGLPTVLRAITWRGPHVTRDRATRSTFRSEYVARKLRVEDTCLYRALARWTALKRAGLPAELVLGLRREAPDTGHAWVELDGAPVDEAADASLMATYRYS